MPATVCVERAPYSISTDRSKLDLAFIHAYLSRDSYWARGIPREVFTRSVEHSLCFGIYAETRQVGFARVISDFATFAYLADVFIDEGHRGRGLSKWLMDTIVSHPDLHGLRRWLLATQDAHTLYARYGFTPLSVPDRLMERLDPAVYTLAGHEAHEEIATKVTTISSASNTISEARGSGLSRPPGLQPEP